MKKAIVTGASGFVGSWLVQELISRHIEVIAVVRSPFFTLETLNHPNPPIRVVVCPLDEIKRLADVITDRDIDAFYHLAWDGVGGAARSDDSLQLSNVRFTCDAAKAAMALGCKKFLCAGTITEKIAENILNSEAKAENTIYGICKHTAHCLLDVLCKNSGMDLIWMRLSNIYGPGNYTGNIAAYTLTEFTKGNIPGFTTGEQPYDLIYIQDAVKAIYLLGTCETTQSCYFIGSGASRLLKDYLEQMAFVYGEGAAVALGKRPEDGLIYLEEWFDITPLHNDTGFITEYTFEQGIEQTIHWLRHRK